MNHSLNVLSSIAAKSEPADRPSRLRRITGARFPLWSAANVTITAKVVVGGISSRVAS